MSVDFLDVNVVGNAAIKRLSLYSEKHSQYFFKDIMIEPREHNWMKFYSKPSLEPRADQNKPAYQPEGINIAINDIVNSPRDTFNSGEFQDWVKESPDMLDD